MPTHPRAHHRFLTAAVCLLFLGGCSESEGEEAADPVPKLIAGSPALPAESWQCRNDLEVRCDEGGCEVETGHAFTPMSVTVDASGAMSVCAYSGCWEGNGTALRSRTLLVFIGHDLEFSTSLHAEAATADIVVTIDLADGIGTLKAEEFAHPLLCTATSASNASSPRPMPTAESRSAPTRAGKLSSSERQAL